jgi:hypothetical protein
MALNESVRQIIQILDEEGFGALAGELMMEVSLGREIERETGQTDNESGIEAEVELIEIPDGEQLGYAMEFLRERLIQPVRAFGEAERMATELSGGKPVRIIFVDAEEDREDEPMSTVESGDTRLADKFENLLERLPSATVTPEDDE